MISDRLVRGALWATVALNTLGVVIFALPAFGHTTPLLPIAVPPYFAAQVALTIGLFGGVYAWLARQPQLNRPLMVVGGLGKLGFFGLTLGYALADNLPISMAVNATPDLVLAGIFLAWARQSR